MVDGATSNSKKIDSNDLLFLEDRRPQTIVLSFDPYIRSSTPQKKDDFLRRGSNPRPSSSKLVLLANTNPQDHGALARLPVTIKLNYSSVKIISNFISK